MAYIDDLVASVADPALRRSLENEIARIKGRTSFGLVFERHIPETSVLPGLQPRQGSLVVLREDQQRSYVVESTNRTKASVREVGGASAREAQLSDLLVVAGLGQPIYPALTSVAAVERSIERPFHSVINGENYHALQLLTYLFSEQVDCIYIDPPYNTGARDWKYNNRFVDSNDAWRHSKWLAMIERRLRLAKRLLKPDGVLIVTVDEHEVHHLGMLLEYCFPEADRQMITIVINPKGVTRPGTVRFSRVEEYAFFCFLGSAGVTGRGDDLLSSSISEDDPQTAVGQRPRWKGLLRSGTNARRQDRPNMFYPVLVDAAKGAVVGTGESLLHGDPDPDEQIGGYSAAWPIRSDGTFGNWGVGNTTLRELIKQGLVSVGSYDDRRRTWPVSYLSEELRAQLAAGILAVEGYDANRNVVDVRYTEEASRRLKTVWHRTRHDAGVGGADVLRTLLGSERLFDFPKSIYAVRDALAAVVGSRPDALILDFFAGSGTTLHSTFLLNAQDGGRRRCIIVTNNELDEESARELELQGYYRGDKEFESMGVFERVTVPRIKAAITGKRADGLPLAGTYKGVDNRPFSAGFDENVEFFRLDYLDKDEVELGRAFEAINPCLWLMSGAQGSRELDLANLGWAIAKGGAYAVLVDETRLRGFKKALDCSPAVRRVFLVTDSEEAYAEMVETLGGEVSASMLYRDYLRNFQINTAETQ